MGAGIRPSARRSEPVSSHRRDGACPAVTRMYSSETSCVLEEKEFREYRTRRLVLGALDRMESNGEFKALGM